MKTVSVKLMLIIAMHPLLHILEKIIIYDQFPDEKLVPELDNFLR